MKILLCSDGTSSSDHAARLTRVLIGDCKASIKLLGVAEEPHDETPLREALQKEAESLRTDSLNVEIIVRFGDPIQQIVDLGAAEKFDLAIISTRNHGQGGLYLRSRRTYEAIKTVPAPVLVITGQCEEFKRFLVCSGGKQFIDEAVRLTGELAKCAGASVTLLHVMAEPPAIYSGLTRLEEDVDLLVKSGSELGENLRREKEFLEKLGVSTQIRVRHGIVIEQIFSEVREGNYNLIVAGTSQATGLLRHYIMGDATRMILNRADCPVLIVRGEKPRRASIFAKLLGRG